MMKSKWKTPELIVLTRNKPEESVLETCKRADGGGSGPVPEDRQCTQPTGCANCSEWQDS